MSNVVETIENTDFLKIPVKSNNNAQAQRQEVMDYTEFVKIEFHKYRQYKILLECIEECVEDDCNLDEDIKNKIKNVLLESSISQTRLNEDSNEVLSETVLGLSLSAKDITYSESNKLRSCIKSKLDKKSQQLENKCSSLFSQDFKDMGKEKRESPLDLCQEDANLLQFRNELAQEQECFLKNQLELLEILEELKNIRLKTVPEVTEQKVQECTVKSKINYLKSQLAKNKCKLDTFKETSNSLKAYTEIIADMKEQHNKLKFDVEQLQDLKKKYAQVSCKEYDDILKSYLQYKSSLEKKKMLFELYK